MESTSANDEKISEAINGKETTVVTPWKVETDCKINYAKLTEEFGTQLIGDDLIERFERITKKQAHPWIKRGIFFSHRALDDFLTAYENGEPVFLYTGRGPTSESLHTGHMIPFMFTKYMQDTFDCPLVIQMADDEKYWFKDIPFKEIYRLGFENAKDIIAFGFNPKKTFIFSNRDYRFQTQEYETFATDVAKFTKQKTIGKIFGFDETATSGMYMWPIYQSIAAFSQAFPHIFNGRPANCMVVYAIDQDPYFRLARDIASKMKLIKPCSIMSTFLDPLTGPGKMSSSVGQESTLFLTDTSTVLRDKIKKYAFSGGGGDGSLEQHKQFGGNPDIDISCKYLKYFEYDDDVYNKICDDFKKGILTCGDTKTLLTDKLIPIIEEHQQKRNSITQNELMTFYDKTKMDLSTIYTKEKTVDELALETFLKTHNISHVTTYHKPNFETDINLQSNIRGVFCKSILFKSDDKYYLFVTPNDINVNAKMIQKKLGLKTLKFANKDELEKTIKCPSLFGTFINHENVTVIVDNKLELCEYVNFYALRNDALMSITYDDMIKFLIMQGMTPSIYNEN